MNAEFDLKPGFGLYVAGKDIPAFGGMSFHNWRNERRRYDLVRRAAIAVRVRGAGHAGVGVRVGEQFAGGAYDGVRVRADQPGRARVGASCRSVVLRRTRTGTSSAGASSCTPPLSVKIRVARCISLTNGT